MWKLRAAVEMNRLETLGGRGRDAIMICVFALLLDVDGEIDYLSAMQ